MRDKAAFHNLGSKMSSFGPRDDENDYYRAVLNYDRSEYHLVSQTHTMNGSECSRKDIRKVPSRLVSYLVLHAGHSLHGCGVIGQHSSELNDDKVWSRSCDLFERLHKLATLHLD